METKYKILIGLGIGAITGSLVGSLLYSLLNKNKDSQRPSSDSDNLTIDDFMNEGQPILQPFDRYKGIRYHNLREN